KSLAADFPLLHNKLNRSCLDFLTRMKAMISKGMRPDENFWKGFLPCFRPFTGYAHLVWQNEDYSQKSLSLTIGMVQDLLDCLSNE
ncbi:MAG: hypothetical protein ACOCPN_03705, partial [Desulfonatronovibrionaceae bacterium]